MDFRWTLPRESEVDEAPAHVWLQYSSAGEFELYAVEDELR